MIQNQNVCACMTLQKTACRLNITLLLQMPITNCLLTNRRTLLSCSPFHNLVTWNVHGHQHGSEISKPRDEQTADQPCLCDVKIEVHAQAFGVPCPSVPLDRPPGQRGKGEQHKGPCVNSCLWLWTVSFFP
jgi:hypothetical protein